MVQCCNGECECKHEFRARRAAGRGTFVEAGTPLSKNESILFDVLKQAIKIYPYGVTVRQLTAFLFNMQPRPLRASNRDWNIHYSQADLSRLTGRGLVNARKMDRGNMLLYTPSENKAV